MSAANGKTRPSDRRPCTECGASIFFAQRVGRDGLSWRPFNAEPSTADGLRQVSHVVVGDQAWRRADLIEHWHVTKEITEDAARAKGYGLLLKHILGQPRDDGPSYVHTFTFPDEDDLRRRSDRRA